MSSAGSLDAITRLLAATERFSREELEQHQLRRLGTLLAHARETVPYYREYPEPSRGEPTFEEFRALPLLGREAVRERAAELCSTKIPQAHRVVREASTSGSSGRHVTVKIDAATEGMGHALAVRDTVWHGRDPRLKTVGIRAITKGAEAPHGRTEPRWSSHPESGPLRLLDVHTAPSAQLDFLVREDPGYLATYPTNVLGLVELAEARGVMLPGLREVGTFGEALPDGLRERVRRVWNVPLVDAYSTAEFGYLALQCSDTTRYHVQAEHVLVEVLREDGSPCAPGETGRVVVTALHAFAMPLLRYDIGDYATVSAPCSCGRGLPTLERILGRSRNRIVLPSGERIWPRFGSNVLGGRFAVKQFRLVQTSEADLRLDVVPDASFTAEDEPRLLAFVLSVIGHPFSLTLNRVAEIPRAKGGKFEDVVCEIE